MSVAAPRGSIRERYEVRRRERKLVRSATASAVAAWVIVGIIAVRAGQDVGSDRVVVASWLAAAFAVLTGLVATPVTLCRSVRWVRNPRRGTGAGVALINVVVAWAGLAIMVVWLR